jgi:hypothetical protein
MNHATVAQQHMTERYLLNELDPKDRDEFEEHFFDCAECALDVHAANLFIENSKVVLAEGPVEVPAVVHAPPKPGWFGWLRPAFAAPAMAVLLAVVGYQNLVTLPQMKLALAPQVMQWGSVNVATYGSTGTEITTAPGQGFLVFARITPQNGYSKYTAELYNPAAKLEWSLTIPASASQGQWPIAVPGADRQPGTYRLVVKGITPAGESVDVGQGSFELHISK